MGILAKRLSLDSPQCDLHAIYLGLDSPSVLRDEYIMTSLTLLTFILHCCAYSVFLTKECCEHSFENPSNLAFNDEYILACVVASGKALVKGNPTNLTSSSFAIKELLSISSPLLAFRAIFYQEQP